MFWYLCKRKKENLTSEEANQAMITIKILENNKVKISLGEQF